MVVTSSMMSHPGLAASESNLVVFVAHPTGKIHLFNLIPPPPPSSSILLSLQPHLVASFLFLTVQKQQ